MRLFAFAAAGSALFLAFSTQARAAPITFELTGSRSASFVIDSTRAPDFFSAFQTQFFDVVGTFDGSPGVASDISFGVAPLINAFEIVGTSLGFTQFSGPTLFGGTTAMPTFESGTFALTSIVSGSSTLTITAPVVPVPEPGGWALLAGFAIAGAVMRFGRRVGDAF